MRWRKLGRVFVSEGQHPWMLSHASFPCVEHVEGDLYRIYFTSRDAGNRSHASWLDLDIARPDRPVRVGDAPLVVPGAPGRFDDCGAASAWLLRHDGQRYLYYTGYNVRNTVPFQTSIGLAVGGVDADPPVLRAYAGPVVDRGIHDPYFCSGPCVLEEAGRWRMWYLGGIGWSDMKRGTSASYNIRYAESSDGVEWRRSGRVAIDLESEDEFAIARPCVVKESDGYSMWYCVRTPHRPYYLGFARSTDGLVWQRDHGDAGLSPSADGWDSEMIAYPYVFDHEGDRYMLYNGNGFGRTGFGLAVLER